MQHVGEVEVIEIVIINLPNVNPVMVRGKENVVLYLGMDCLVLRLRRLLEMNIVEGQELYVVHLARHLEKSPVANVQDKEGLNVVHVTATIRIIDMAKSIVRRAKQRES